MAAQYSEEWKNVSGETLISILITNTLYFRLVLSVLVMLILELLHLIQNESLFLKENPC